MIKALLIVVVIGGGGPHGTKSSQLADGVIAVRHNGHVVAEATSGKLKVRLNPGLYSVRASLGAPNPTGPCMVRPVRVKQGRVSHLRMSCSFP